ncbi:MAG TPA: ChbG/HpnK family deacetylase [Candidatus Angelobacter sp.]|nr:ChbG/HpnK family deacetylase [Candidatus Angelobacter sp.]
MPRLIINADDFGLTSGINRAIAEAGHSGAITSATLMARSRAFDEAVSLSEQTSKLSIGCHVVLIDGEPICPNLPTLARNGSRFRDSLKEFAVAAVRKQISQEEVRREAEAQIRKIQSAGITVTHIDSHKHTHVFPHVLRPVLQAAKACGVSAVRNPFEPRRIWPRGLASSTSSLWSRAAGVRFLQIFSKQFQQAVHEEGMLTTDGTAGIMITGMLNQDLLNCTLRSLPEGTWELVCHPGYLDDDLRAAGTRLLESREIELKALSSSVTKNVLAEQHIEPISFADLKHS